MFELLGLRVDHVFSCEVLKKKRAFINTMFPQDCSMRMSHAST
jgi:hypothetical protein